MFSAEKMTVSSVESNSVAQFLMHCCLIGAYLLKLSARASGLSDVIDYRIVEGQQANTLIGNVPVDAGLHTMYTAQILTSFRYRLLPTDSDTQPSNCAPYICLSLYLSVCNLRTRSSRKPRSDRNVACFTLNSRSGFEVKRSKVTRSSNGQTRNAP